MPVTCLMCGGPTEPPAPCPACGLVEAAPGEPLPLADEIPKAVPVRPPAPRRRREPVPPVVTEEQAARGVRWAIILFGFMMLGMCLLGPWLIGPLPDITKKAK